MKRLISLALCLIMVSSLLTACGGKTETSEKSKTPSVNDTETKTEPVTTKKVELKLSLWGNDERKAVFEELLKPFNEANNCTVEVVLVPFDEYMQKLSIQLASNSAPDVVWLAEKMVPQFIESGELVDLSTAVKADAEYDFDDFFPSTLDLFTRGDEIYGLPFSFGPRVIYYNKTLFEAKGLPTPTDLYKEGKWTLDAFFESAKALTDSGNGVYGMKLQGATEPTAYMNSLYDIVLSNGAEYFNDDMTEFILNSEGGINAMTRYYNAMFVDESHVKPGDQTQFETGKIAMARDTFSYAANLRGKVDFEWDIVAAPKGSDPAAKVTSGFANYSVTKGENQELGIKLAMFLTSKETMMDLVATFPSPRSSVLGSDAFLNQPEGLPNAESVKMAFVDQIASPGVKAYPSHENYQKIDVEINRLFELMFTKEYTPDSIVDLMKEAVDPLLK